MAPQRRNFERRRRVLYYAHQSASAPGGVHDMRETQRLREARRPTTAYGSRVRHRLRGRWFSLVPVRQRTLWIVAGSLFMVSLLLCFLHFAAIRFPLLANQPAIARPLRLDRPDSLGVWLSVALLTACTGVSLLIYQLRRHRNDDFAGRYRLWRTVLVVSALASLNSQVSLIDWGGAILDASFGRRVALSGSDWIRLVVSFGGLILTMQLVAEMHRCRAAVGILLGAVAFLAIPQMANWNLLQVDTITNWTLVTTAPLIGTTALFLSMFVYLRMLYREVRKIEAGPSLRERMHDWKVKLLERDNEPELSEPEDWRASPLRRLKVHKPNRDRQAKDQSPKVTKDQSPKVTKDQSPKVRPAKASPVVEDESREDEKVVSEEAAESESQTTSVKVKKRRWWQRQGLPSLRRNKDSTADNTKQDDSRQDDSNRRKPDEVTEETDEVAKDAKSSRRLWSGFRSKKGSDNVNEPKADDRDESGDDENAEEKPKRRWFGRRTASAADDKDPSSTDQADTDSPPAKKRRFSMRLQPRKMTSTDEAADEAGEAERPSPSPSLRPAPAAADSDPHDDEDYIDPDSIDWASLNKSEKRRLRKKIKRQGRAA